MRDSKHNKNLVERGVRAPGKETVELAIASQTYVDRDALATYLDEQEQVGILALGRGTAALLDVVLFDVDTLEG